MVANTLMSCFIGFSHAADTLDSGESRCRGYCMWESCIGGLCLTNHADIVLFYEKIS